MSGFPPTEAGSEARPAPPRPKGALAMVDWLLAAGCPPVTPGWCPNEEDRSVGHEGHRRPSVAPDRTAGAVYRSRGVRGAYRRRPRGRRGSADGGAAGAAEGDP